MRVNYIIDTFARVVAPAAPAPAAAAAAAATTAVAERTERKGEGCKYIYNHESRRA